MIRLIALCLSVSCLSALDLGQEDKRFHLGASAIGSALIDTGLQIAKPEWTPIKRMSHAAGSMFAVGIAKELADATGMGNCDIEDLYADAIGCLIGAPIAEATGGLIRASISPREVTLALSWNF